MTYTTTSLETIASGTEPVGQKRKETLLKLIQVEPDHLGNLVHATGWGEAQTRMTLMQLTVDGLVSRHNQGGVQIYKATATQKTQLKKGRTNDE